MALLEESRQQLNLSRLLPRIRNGIILANPDLALPLVHDMLNPDLLCMLRLVLSDPPRIPKLTGDSEVLAASH